jgi:hypothetical protein
MPISHFDIHGWVRENMRVTKQKIVVQINLNKPIDYTIVWAQAMVTHVISYDVLVGGVVLYP